TTHPSSQRKRDPPIPFRVGGEMDPGLGREANFLYWLIAELGSGVAFREAGAGIGTGAGCSGAGGRLAGGTGRSGAAGPVITSKSSDIETSSGGGRSTSGDIRMTRGRKTRKPPAGGAASGCCANAWT